MTGEKELIRFILSKRKKTTDNMVLANRYLEEAMQWIFPIIVKIKNLIIEYVP